jgi:hypothetical protein
LIAKKRLLPTETPLWRSRLSSYKLKRLVALEAALAQVDATIFLLNIVFTHISMIVTIIISMWLAEHLSSHTFL